MSHPFLPNDWFTEAEKLRAEASTSWRLRSAPLQLA